MAEINLSLLGACNVCGNDSCALDFRLSKTKLLLIYLSMQQGVSTSREKLAYLFWTEHQSTQARANLRQVLSELRKFFEPVAPSCLRADRTEVSLDPSCVNVDAIEFGKLSELDKREPLEQAAQLYNGQFLDGIGAVSPAFDDWIDHERRRLHRAAIATFGKLTKVASANGDIRAAISSAERNIELDSFDENAYRKLMELLASAGRHDASLVLFEQCRETLERELSVEPQPETERLAQEIRAQRQNRTEVVPLRNQRNVSENEPQTQTSGFAVDEQSYDFAQRLLNRPSTMRRWLTTSVAGGLAVMATTVALNLNGLVDFGRDISGDGFSTVQIENSRVEGSANESPRHADLDLFLPTSPLVDKPENVSAAAEFAFDEGQRMFDMQTPQSFSAGVAKIMQALEAQPGFPQAHSALAKAYAQRHVMHWDSVPGLNSDGPGLAKSLHHARLALKEDHRQAVAQAVLAKATFFGDAGESRYEDAIAMARQAFVLDPREPEAYISLAQIFIYGGEPERAIPHLELARDLSTNGSGEAEYLLALASFHLEQFSDAISFAEMALEKSPNAYFTWALLAASHGYLGNTHEAIWAINHARSLSRSQKVGPISVQLIPGYLYYIDPVDRARLRHGLDFACILIGAGPDG
jgi:DNA-binding SARP family transcriptional activator